MLENIYTTKMSANKKQLQKRFTKIRSHSGRISKMMSFVMAIFVAVTMLCATVVMAIMNKQETGQTDNNNKIQGTNISYSPQNINESELYQNDTSSISLQQSESYDKTSENNLTNDKIEKQSIDLSRISVDEKKIKSSSVSDELYVGFEQIVLSNINSTEIQKELQDNGITQTHSTSVDLEQNYIVNDFTADKTQVTADANGNISIYMSIESDNLFDVQITDSETNEDVGQFTILANNDNVYSFFGFEQGKNYNVEVKSKTKNDWNVIGNYILY